MKVSSAYLNIFLLSALRVAIPRLSTAHCLGQYRGSRFQASLRCDVRYSAYELAAAVSGKLANYAMLNPRLHHIV